MATPYFYLDEDSSQDDNQSPIPHADEILNNGCGENLDTKSTRLRKKVALTAPQLDGLFYYDHHLSKQDASLEANRFQPDSSDIVNQSQHSESYNSRCSFSFAGSTVPQSSLLHLSMGASFSSQLSSTHLTHSVVRNDVSGDPAILVYWDLINELLDEQNWKRLEQLAASLRDITDLLLSDTTWLSLDFQSLSELISVFALLVLDEKLTNFNVVSEPQSPSKSKKSTGSRKLAHIPDEFKGSLPSGGASHATPSEMGNIPVTDSMEIANNLEDAGTSTGIFPISVNSENMTGGSTAAHNNVATSSVKSDMLATCSTKSTCPARMITANPADALAAAATEASDNIGLSTDNTSGLAVTPTMIKALPKNDQPISESAKKEVSFAEPRCVVLDEPVQRPVSPTGSGGSNAVLETNHEDEWKNHVISQLLIVYDLLQKVHHVRIFERHVPISLAACFGYAKHYGPSAPAASNTCSNCKTSLSSGPSTVSTSLLPYHLSPNLCQACQTRDTPGSLPTCFPFPYINLQCMRSLQSLNINRVPWHKIHGLSCHRSRRLRYIMMRRAGMTSLEQLAAHCCADQAQKQAWHHLLELDVSYNPLRTLDSSVCLFPNITALHLTHCDLTTAEGLQQMTARLTFLDLSYNKLSTVPGLSASCCQSLLTLRIVANFIVSLRGLARLESLEHLELQDNLILMSGSLAPLGCLSELRSLRLAGNPVCYVRDSRYAIVSRLHPKVNDLKIILDERRLTNDEAALVASKNWIFVRQEACVTAGTDPVMSPEVVLRAQQAALPPSDSRLLPVLRPIDGPVRPKRKRSTKRTRLVEIAEPMGDEPQGDSTGVSYSSGTSPSETGIASCSSHPPSSNSASAGSPRDLRETEGVLPHQVVVEDLLLNAAPRSTTIIQSSKVPSCSRTNKPVLDKVVERTCSRKKVEEKDLRLNRNAVGTVVRSPSNCPVNPKDRIVEKNDESHGKIGISDVNGINKVSDDKRLNKINESKEDLEEDENIDKPSTAGCDEKYSNGKDPDKDGGGAAGGGSASGNSTLQSNGGHNGSCDGGNSGSERDNSEGQYQGRAGSDSYRQCTNNSVNSGLSISLASVVVKDEPGVPDDETVGPQALLLCDDQAGVNNAWVEAVVHPSQAHVSAGDGESFFRPLNSGLHDSRGNCLGIDTHAERTDECNVDKCGEVKSHVFGQYIGEQESLMAEAKGVLNWDEEQRAILSASLTKRASACERNFESPPGEITSPKNSPQNIVTDVQAFKKATQCKCLTCVMNNKTFIVGAYATEATLTDRDLHKLSSLKRSRSVLTLYPDDMTKDLQIDSEDNIWCAILNRCDNFDVASFTSNRGSSGNSRGLKARNAPPASYECRVIEYCPPFFYERRPLNAACHNSGRYYGASSPPREEDDAMDQTLHCDSRWSLRRMECVISISGRVMVETSDDCKQGFKVVFTQLRSVAVMADTRLRVTFCDPHHNVLHRTYELLPHVLQSLMKHFRLLLADSKLQFKVNDALTCQHCQHVFSSSLTVSVEGFPHALCPDCGWTTDGQQVDLHLVNATLREQQRVVCSIFPGVGPLLPICSQPCSHSLCSVAAARRSARCNSAINLQNFRDPLMRSLSVNSLTSSSFSIDQSAATLGYPSYYNRQNKKSSNGNISTGFETNLSSYPYDGLFDDPNLTCAPAHVISASLDAIAKKASCPVTAGGLSAIAHSQNRVVHRSQKLNEVNSSESFPTDRVLSKSADEQIADFIKQKLASTSPPNSLCRRNNSTHRQNHLRLSGTLGMSQQSLQNRTILMDTSMTTEPIDFGKPVSGIRASTQSLTPSPVVAPRHERVGLARAELAECQPLFQNLTDSVQVQKLSGSCTPGGRNAQQEAKVFLSKREMDKSKWNKENMRPMLGWMPNTVATIAEPNCYSEQLHASISRGGHDYELRKHSVSLLYSDDHSSVAARDVLRQRLVT
ncbi:uncharacterized protein LOC108669576 isoform X1 [Hyalella azteca]|uniref:Uncharacterized protein LOC108669576 isoform X1 n=1 Tax=Hyalella azteca TaxID=294128 RepID=A0A8B7NFQ1_HYAAZ|nr:uncharacterized protein LOC108669576 isoform X1 [Hyalella azteca]